MGSASGDLQIFPLVFGRVVDLVSVRDAYPAEIFQEFPRMAGIASAQVFIQDDLPVCIHPSGAVNPHIAFASGGLPVLVYQNRCLVRLQYMVTVHFFMQVIIEDRKVAVRTLDRQFAMFCLEMRRP